MAPKPKAHYCWRAFRRHTTQTYSGGRRESIQDRYTPPYATMVSPGSAAAAARVKLVVPLGESAGSFSLEKAVCSHGLFMMAPNRWDPLSLTLTRPLRLDDDGDDLSVMARISYPSRSESLHVTVFGVSSLSPAHEAALASQVKRMLRFSEADERSVREFHRMCQEKEAPKCMRDFGGRMVRSPTLFEDMVKCILLCNCQFSRSLSMANALCELQLELQPSQSKLFGRGGSSTCETPNGDKVEFAPTTPALKESKRTCCKSVIKFPNSESQIRNDANTILNVVESSTSFHKTTAAENYETSLASSEDTTDMHPAMDEDSCIGVIGNFPSPKELASLDERFLVKRCKLGYRGGRILKLAKGIVEGSIQLSELEEMCDIQSLSSYSELMERLRRIDGFGPFTCSNVLMCMGFHHVIPTDSETIRHLKQVHAKISTNQTVQRDVAELYAQYAPFQFFAYWAELWSFYEQRFGKLSDMAMSNYGLITASNMKPKQSRPKKRAKLA